MKNNYETTEKIKKQEKKDRFIVTVLLTKLFANYADNYTITAHPFSAATDINLHFTKNGEEKSYEFEIKERNKDINKYNFAELRVKKLQHIKENYKDNIYYIVLLNQKTAYIYNLSKIDFNEIETFKWTIKDTQLDNNSTVSEHLTYKIPTSFAVRQINVTDIYNLYNNTFNNAVYQ